MPHQASPRFYKRSFFSSSFFSSSSVSPVSHPQSGSVLTMLFVALAAIGLLSYVTYNMLSGPVRAVATVTMRSKAQSEMLLAARLLMRSATDVDGDNVVEPPEYDAMSRIRPAGGGGIPASVGANKIDPWRTPYGYCVWNHGSETGGVNRSVGDAVAWQDKIAVVIISAGPNRVFETQCSDQAPYVVLAANSDDIIERFTFEQIEAMGDQFWKKSEVEPDKIQYTEDSVLIGTIASPSNASLQVGGDSEMGGNLVVSGTLSVNRATRMYGRLDLDNDASVQGSLEAHGGITNTVIGATDPQPGTFTTLDARESVTAVTGDFDVLKALNATIGDTLTADGGIFNTIRVASTTRVENLNADYLDGQHGAYYLNTTNMNAGTLDPNRMPGFTGDVAVTRANATTLATSVVRLQGRNIANTAPAANTVLGWNGTAWHGRR